MWKRVPVFLKVCLFFQIALFSFSAINVCVGNYAFIMPTAFGAFFVWFSYNLMSRYKEDRY